MDYQLEIKQTVDYPRCRIYREFIRTLMEDRNIRSFGNRPRGRVRSPGPGCRCRWRVPRDPVQYPFPSICPC